MMKMDAPGDAITRLVSRMFEAPALRRLTALQKEEQALQFFKQNGAQLQPVLASVGIGGAGRDTVAQLVREARSLADAMLEREISRAADECLQYIFVPALGTSRVPPAASREEIKQLCRRSATHPVARMALAGSLSAVLSDITDKYIPHIWERRKYTFMEVARVQRLTLKAEECADLLRLTLLVRPAAYLHVVADARQGPEAGYAPVQEATLDRALPGLRSQMAGTPPDAVRMGVRAALSFPGTPGLEAVSRLTAIFALRGRSLAPAMVVDRGADSPDKSWFNVARRNATWRGLDPRMLDELYSIAAENGW